MYESDSAIVQNRPSAARVCGVVDAGATLVLTLFWDGMDQCIAGEVALFAECAAPAIFMRADDQLQTSRPNVVTLLM